MWELFLISSAHAGSISSAPAVGALLRNILNFLLSVAGIVAIIGLVVAAFLYLTAAGDETRARLAKRALVASVIGLVVIFGAWVIITQLATWLSA